MLGTAQLVGVAFGTRCGGHEAAARVVEADPVTDLAVIDCVHTGGLDGTHGYELPVTELLTLLEG